MKLLNKIKRKMVQLDLVETIFIIFRKMHDDGKIETNIPSSKSSKGIVTPMQKTHTFLIYQRYL